ncbi:diguanylate cyclase [Candidatus Sulfurimonas baltica]|uniref:diguanylate cyclase n=1 Tax=Candidatus Sulfurimonas baltica TaxID=2740404 RepID=A0A7S7LVD2_9BACT|nr:diguanylate cyclase [Candidatus Sulfurimonas baltica]QOY52187.1 diguanylate cyclase [Candidatus Sulfurimonas baltica]
MRLKLIPKTSKYYYRFILILLFVFVGFIISAVSIFVSGYYQLNAMHKEFDTSAKNTLFYKKEFLRSQTDNFKNYLAAVEQTSEFEAFIRNDLKSRNQTKDHIASIMMAITHSNPSIMQFRFIDNNGDETIRIDRDSSGGAPYNIDKKSLQNKADRYYFQETKDVAKGRAWFSNVDLSIEDGKIVQPVVPMLRVAKAYYDNDRFKGILIINIFMKKILEEATASELFNLAIFDKDSYILCSNHDGCDKNSKTWTKYLEHININCSLDEYKNNTLLKLLFRTKQSSIEISDIIENGEGLKIVLEEKRQKLIEHTKDIIDYVLVMGIIVFTISFPLAIMLSSYPLRLHEKLEKFKNNLVNKIDIIDKFVCMSRTDIDGNIIEVSTAFTKLTGYTKDELVGKNHRILKSKETPASLHQNMWRTILHGKNWTGILKNIRKNGDEYWIRNNITPIIENEKITGFTSIIENITSQKLIEEISIKDELTQAYNRRFFNQMFHKELRRARRNGKMFCVAMFDIDYFKKYNDTYGHIKGDEALQKVVAQVSLKLQRPSDYLFRIGGEEFIVIYSDEQSFDEAKMFSSEILMSVKNLNIEHTSSLNDDVLTISLGLLNVTPDCKMDESAILKRVDELLYIAKEAGRNQLVSEEC